MAKGPEQTILQTGHTEGPEIQERMLAVRKVQIKTTMRYHLTPVRVANINKSTNKCWRGCWERMLLGMQTGESTVVNSMEFPQKTKNGTAL